MFLIEIPLPPEGNGGEGDGDGYVSATFNLPAGPYTSYGVNVGLSVIPEPSSLSLTAITGLGLRRRRN